MNFNNRRDIPGWPGPGSFVRWLGGGVKQVITAPLAAPALKDSLDLALCGVAKAAGAQWVLTAGGARQPELARASARDLVGDDEAPTHKHPVDHGEQGDPRCKCRWPDIFVDNEHIEYADYEKESIDHDRRRRWLVEERCSLRVLRAGEHLWAP